MMLGDGEWGVQGGKQNLEEESKKQLGWEHMNLRALLKLP